MSDKEWTKDENELDKASKGEICPKCKRTNIKFMGNTPDGMNANNCFGCLDCKEQWEGY